MVKGDVTDAFIYLEMQCFLSYNSRVNCFGSLFVMAFLVVVVVVMFI